jgi:hypothetical protein
LSLGNSRLRLDVVRRWRAATLGGPRGVARVVLSVEDVSRDTTNAHYSI